MKDLCTRTDCGLHSDKSEYTHCSHPYEHAELEHQCIKNGYTHFVSKEVFEPVLCEMCSYSYHCPIGYDPKEKPCEAYNEFKYDV